jgi:hypothetical protein
LLVVPKAKPVKKESYYLIDLEELMTRVRMEMNAIFYSAAEMINDFLEFRQKWMDNGATIMKEGEDGDNDNHNNNDD